MEAKVNGTPVQALLDSGAELSTADAAFAPKLGLIGGQEAAGHGTRGGLGGARTFSTVRLKSLTLGGRTFKNVEAAVDERDGESDLNVGVSLLKNFRIVTDFAHHRLWLLP